LAILTISNRPEKLKSIGDHVCIFSRFECYAARMTPPTHLVTRYCRPTSHCGEVVTAS